MKFNLKTRLKKPMDYVDYFNSTEAWFEGFEKELIKRFNMIEGEKVLLLKLSDLEDLIKEILGEKQK